MSNLIKTFRNPKSRRNYLISHKLPEFTTECPESKGQELVTIEVQYVPGKWCMETFSLTEYVLSYQNREIHYEATINQILDDVIKNCKPNEAKVTGIYKMANGTVATIKTFYKRPWFGGRSVFYSAAICSDF